eukprot:gene20826-27656_t
MQLQAAARWQQTGRAEVLTGGVRGPGAGPLMGSKTAQDCLGMDLLAKSTEASDWKLKGEGNANIILSYVGVESGLVGYVVRVRKLWCEKEMKEQTAERRTKKLVEEAVWKGVLKSAGDASDKDLEFVTDYLAPLLGPQAVHPGVQVVAPEGAVKFLENMGVISRGKDDPAVDYPALLLPDHTVFSPTAFPKGWKPSGATICVELKPKCGFMPSDCPYLAPESEIKRTVPRFAMHQVLKKSEINHGHVLSQYDPVELFSDDLERIQKALVGLLDAPNFNSKDYANVNFTSVSPALLGLLDAPNTLLNDCTNVIFTSVSRAQLGLLDAPNNNMRVFIEGKLAFGSVHVGSGSETRQALRECLRKMVAKTPGTFNQNESIMEDTLPDDLFDEMMVTIVARALHNTGVMNKLLAVQKLDKIDVEGVLPLYQRLLQRYDADSLHARPSVLTQPCELVGELPSDVALEQWGEDSMCAALRGYLAAATAKDCGAKDTAAEEFKKKNFHTLEYVPTSPVSFAGTFAYKIAFVDLEVKLASKIPKHHKLDQSVMRCAKAHPDELQSLGYKVPS